MKLDDVRAIQYGDVLVEGERWPNSIHVIEHPDGRVLVDTGMIDSTPELDAEWGVRFDPDKIPRDVVCVINTHLHFDHCGGNRLFAGTPIHVQRAEREAAREAGLHDSGVGRVRRRDVRRARRRGGDRSRACAAADAGPRAGAPVGARRHRRRARRARRRRRLHVEAVRRERVGAAAHVAAAAPHLARAPGASRATLRMTP